jgi:glycosyltransferase involved in cell wall biosynthesis
LHAYAEALGIAYAVRFTGFVNDTAPYYQLMRINVNASTGTETSCLALSEGMSASLPMIVSDFGGNRAMIGNSDAGIVIPMNDAMALANGILEILNDPEREETMRAAARKRFEECYGFWCVSRIPRNRC